MSKQLEALARKHPDKIDSVYWDSDGYWVDLIWGWNIGNMEHLIHAQTVAEILYSFKKELRRCEAGCQCHWDRKLKGEK